MKSNGVGREHSAAEITGECNNERKGSRDFIIPKKAAKCSFAVILSKKSKQRCPLFLFFYQIEMAGFWEFFLEFSGSLSPLRAIGVGGSVKIVPARGFLKCF